MSIHSKLIYFFVFLLYVSNSANSCPPIGHKKGVNLECTLSNGTILDCGSNEIPRGTIAKYSCGKYYYREKSPRQGELLCSENGQWDYCSNFEDFHCQIDCGTTRRITPMIVVGSDADKLDFPWHASIFHRNSKYGRFNLICGGSLINLNDQGPFILTAAHCLNRGSNMENYRVVLGGISSTFLKNKDNDTQIFGVSYYAKHPSYNRNTFGNDIGIMKLSGDPELSDSVKPICLEMDTPQPKSGDEGIIAGFGMTEAGEVSEKLLYGTLPVRNREECLKASTKYQSNGFPDTKFCAGFSYRDNAFDEDYAENDAGYQKRSGICSGDSGGGFATFNSVKRRSTLVGVAYSSFKDTYLVCSGFGYFQNVQKYIGWIRETQKTLYPATTSDPDEGLNIFAKRCGSDPDWVEYKDKKCFRLVKQMVTKEEASRICGLECGTNSLPILKSYEEYEFLLKFLEVKRVRTGVWLGATRGPSGFHWDNGDGMGSFSKWQSWNFGNKNCSKLVQNTGNWVAEDCGAKNLVICEKMQEFSNAQLLQGFFKLRSDFEEFQKRTNAKLDDIIPVGFIYFQVGKQPPPDDLWPQYIWKDISSTYSGLFFRVTGGGAAPFGTIQSENSPRLGSVEFFTSVQSSISNKITIGSDGTHYYYLNNQNYDPESKYRDGYKFKLTNTGEVRPKNTAIRVWKRIIE